PVLSRTGQRTGGAVLTGTGYVVYLKHADQPVLLAQRDDVGDIGGAVAGPALPVAQHYPNGIGSGGGNVGERTGLARVPGMRVIDPAHHERLAVAIKQLGAGNAETGESVARRQQQSNKHTGGF